MITKIFFLVAMASAAPLKVGTTFSVLADIVNQIGIDTKAEALVGADSDVHAFEPSPRDLQALAKYDLIVINGLGLDFWADRLTKASQTRALTARATEGANLIGNDPHCWQDPLCGIQYVENIKNALVKLQPVNASAITKKAAGYQAEVRTIYNKYKKEFDMVPIERRKILTSHDSLAYFGRTYGVEIYTLRGSTTNESTAAQLAHLTRLIQQKKVRVAFFENSVEDRALRQLAKDHGLKIGGTLYTDSLSKEPAGSSYLKMISENARRVLDQLRAAQ